MSFQKKNQITQISKFCADKHVVFLEAIEGKVPGNSSIKYKRVPIGTVYDDGTTGDLIIKLPKDSFSFGISASHLSGGTQPDSYSFPISLYDNNQVRPDQQQIVDLIRDVMEASKAHLVKNGPALFGKKVSAEYVGEIMSSPLYGKKIKIEDKGVTTFVANPDAIEKTLYSQLIWAKSSNVFYSKFYDATKPSVELNPMDLIGVRGITTALIKIESIFIRDKTVKLCVKLYECLFKPQLLQNERLLVNEDEDQQDHDSLLF